MELQDGRYLARGVRAEMGVTSTGKEQVGVELELLGEGYQGAKMSWYGYFTEKAFEITLKALRTLGWSGADLGDLTGIDANEVELVIQNETYEGKTRAKVQFINPVGGLSMKEQMPPEAVRSFAARMKGQILAFDQSAGTRPKATTRPAVDRRPEPPPMSDSDIPF